MTGGLPEGPPHLAERRRQKQIQSLLTEKQDRKQGWIVQHILRVHTLIVLLHHGRHQTTLSSCEHLSSIHGHGIGLLTLHDEWEDESSGAKTTPLYHQQFLHHLTPTP